MSISIQHYIERVAFSGTEGPASTAECAVGHGGR